MGRDRFAARSGRIEPVQWPTDAPADLGDEVACLWSAEMAAGERLVPDGCIDLVWIPEQGRLWVCGPERTSWTSPTPEGTTAVGARLRPGSEDDAGAHVLHCRHGRHRRPLPPARRSLHHGRRGRARRILGRSLTLRGLSTPGTSLEPPACSTSRRCRETRSSGSTPPSGRWATPSERRVPSAPKCASMTMRRPRTASWASSVDDRDRHTTRNRTPAWARRSITPNPSAVAGVRKPAPSGRSASGSAMASAASPTMVAVDL